MAGLIGIAIVLGLISWVTSALKKKAANKRYVEAEKTSPRRQRELDYEAPVRQPARPAHRPTTGARWIPAGTRIDVAGFSIPGGMLYFGEQIDGLQYGSCANCVLDPMMKVASRGEDRTASTMPYWPAYQAIQPVARRTYLGWLAGGRRDPDIGIGYVFLFFYGLERRLVVDGAGAEEETLIAELRRLIDIYGYNNSFSGYVTRLLDAVKVRKQSGFARPALSNDTRDRLEMPLDLRAYLGWRLAAKEPLDPEDALAWVLGLPDTYLRVPAQRCFEELVQLWHMRFAERYPHGLKVTLPKTQLKVDYRAASGGWTKPLRFVGPSGPLPDIAAITAPVAPLREMLASLTDELAAYSRLLGKNPEARGTIEATLLLPAELRAAAISGDITARVDAMMAGRTAATVSSRQLLDVLDISITDTDKIPAAQMNQVAALMDHLGLGFEPDRRYGGSPLRLDGKALVFRALDGGPVDGGAPAFSAGRVMVEIAALAAGADQSVAQAEMDAVSAEIRGLPDLSVLERARLIAYASVLMRDPAHQRTGLQKFKSIDASAKQLALKTAMAAVMADGHASPAEVKFLERLSKAIGLPGDGVYSILHRSAAILDEPVAVEPAEQNRGVAIPQMPRAKAAGGIEIDEVRLGRLRSETAAVSQLLAGIFVEPEPTPPVRMVVTETVVASRFSGLDGAHATLLSYALELKTVDRAGFEKRARSLRLLPDGAIELINDWGFERFEEPILEGDDDISIAPHIHAALTEAEART